MKKTALTFGLFSLVMVATSSATTKTQATSSDKKISVILPVDGATGGGRKQDRVVKSSLVTKNNEFGFASINQSLGGNKKVD